MRPQVGISVSNRRASSGFNPLSFNPLHIWDSDNFNLPGGNTIWEDYNNVGAQYNVDALPQGISPPRLANDPEMNNNDVFFTGGVIMDDNVVFRNSDGSGCVFIVIKPIALGSDADPNVLFSASSNGQAKYFRIALINGFPELEIIGSASGNSKLRGNVAATTDDAYVLAVYSDGAETKIRWNGGSALTLNAIQGSNTGDWLDGFSPSLTDVAVTGLDFFGGTQYGNNKWAHTSYLPYTNEQAVIDYSLGLRSKYLTY